MSSNKSTKQQSGSQSNSDEGWRSIPNSAVTSSFGGMHPFMASYGLKPTPDGYEEARHIIDAFKQADYAEQQESNKKN